MRKRFLIGLMLLFLLVPAIARAAPRTATLDEHLTLLKTISGHLERAKAASPDVAVYEIQQARSATLDEWLVQTPHGEVGVDLRPLNHRLFNANVNNVQGRHHLSEAADVVKEYIASAESLRQATAQPLPPDARQRLERALAEAKTNQRWYERLGEWLAKLFQRMRGEPETNTAASETDSRIWLAGALAVGLIGLAVLIRSLLRALSGSGPGDDAALKGSRSVPSRPLTPAEMREQARRLASEGEYQTALRTVHLSLLKRYDETGLVRYHPAETNREYERHLRRTFPGLARTMRTLHSLIEDRLYSGHGAGEGDFAAADGLVEQLWREGDAASKSAEATTGASSSASSR